MDRVIMPRKRRRSLGVVSFIGERIGIDLGD
jgi:hypothetical protein